MEKKHTNILINLRMDQSQAPIPSTIRQMPFYSTTEILKNPKKKKKPFKDRLLRRHTITNIETIDFSQFNSVILFDDSPNASMSLKSLMDENYTFYIDKLRKIYPNFRFNHYSKYFEHIRQINQISINNNMNNTCPNPNITSFEYKENDKMNMMSIDKSFQCPCNKFMINAGILEQKKENLEMAVKLYDSKVEGIEMELDKVLVNSSWIESYIEDNLHLEKNIEGVIQDFVRKREMKERFKKSYMGNSANLLLKKNKRQNIGKVFSVLRQLNGICEKVEVLRKKTMKGNNSESDNKENDDNDDNEILSNLKNSITALRRNKEFKFAIEIEKEVQKFNDQSEVKYIEQFMQSINRIITQCFILNTINENNDTSSFLVNGLNKKTLSANNTAMTFNLDSIQEHKENYFNEKNQLYFYYLILLPNKTHHISQILNYFSIIITENIDISTIIDKLKLIFLTKINLLNDHLKKTLSTSTYISALSTAYHIFIENYNYLLELLNQNCGTSPKMFNELTKYIKGETKSRLIPQINTMINDMISLGDVEQLLFTKEKIKTIIVPYLQSISITFNDYYSQYEHDFIFQFFQSHINKIKESVDKEDWTQVIKVPINYQKVINVIMIDFQEITKEQLYSIDSSMFNINTTTTPPSENLIEHIEIKDHKVIVMKSTLSLVSFIFDTYKLLFYMHKDYSQTIILQLCKWTTFYLNKANDIIIQGNGKINNKNITEKEFLLLNATIIILKHIFFTFITYFIAMNDTDINETINSVLIKINEIHMKCQKTIEQIVIQVLNATIEEFTKLDFKEYPTFPIAEKNYNAYVRKYGIMKKIYDSMLNAFEGKDIVELYRKVFGELLEKMYQIASGKGRIENDGMLKQFRSEMMYMKKVLKGYGLLEIKDHVEKIEAISVMVNPNKKQKKKKKEKDKEEKEKDGNKKDDSTKMNNE